MGNRIGGIESFTVDGVAYPVKQGWSKNFGRPIREGIAGADTVHGYTENPQVPYLEGPITITKDVDVEALLSTTDATVVLEDANNRFILRNAWFAGEGEASTGEGELSARFEALECDIDRKQQN